MEEDRIVVDALLTSANDVHNYDMTPEFLNALVQRIQEEPELLRQIFAEFRRSRGSFAPPCNDEGWFVARLAQDMIENSETTAEKSVHLFVLASAFDRPEWVADLDWKKVPERWRITTKWLQQHKYYIVFDHEHAVYVVDQSAKRNGTRVVPSRQTWLK